MKQFPAAILLVLAINLSLFAQTEPQLVIRLLANDNIAGVNIDQDKYIKAFGTAVEVIKKEFADIPSDQTLAIILTGHKMGRPTIEVYSKPTISASKEQSFLSKMNDVKFENTKIVDFPILVMVNIAHDDFSKGFKEIILPTDKTKIAYQNSDIKGKFALNKAWAINEVLPVLSAYEVGVEDRFTGVKNMGKLVSQTNFSTTHDITKLTSNNTDYWRAVLEMELGNQLIPATKIFMLIAQGEFDYASRYLEIVKLFSDNETITDAYLNDLSWRLNLFNNQLTAEIQKGIKEHDSHNFARAIDIYSDIIGQYPNSAWGLYELYYSQDALDVKNKKKDAEDRAAWNAARIKIYKSNPVYPMDVRASNANEGYLLFRRQEISSLFQNKENRINDIYTYADISLDLGVYDFAAQLFWYCFSKDPANDNALKRFLYCLEKLDVKTLKENFKGNFEKEFEKIDAEKEKEMTQSKIYKAFK